MKNGCNKSRLRKTCFRTSIGNAGPRLYGPSVKVFGHMGTMAKIPSREAFALSYENHIPIVMAKLLLKEKA